MNPFVASWDQNSESSQGTWVLGSQGPTYGALPTLPFIPYSMIFNFIMHNQSILNCNVNGTNSMTYLQISTNSTTTTISKRNGEVYGSIDWSGLHATVYAHGSIKKQRASQWARLSSDARRRLVTISGREYAWIPRGNAICVSLHSDDASKSGEIARITKNHSTATVTLQLTIEAFNAGFFEPSVLATVLFLSGRNID
ncbi:hypothetical protein CPC08DRAFT_644340 [Agrocybe pediades]|nr:hypothetical protein CPC08DRAFT_644340 [Agrocybe pediades]